MPAQTETLVPGLPDSVPLGARTFNIERHPDDNPKVGDEMGGIDYEDQTILVCVGQPLYERISILFHEIAHDRLDRTGISHLLTQPQQEAICDFVGGMVAELFASDFLTFKESTPCKTGSKHSKTSATN